MLMLAILLVTLSEVLILHWVGLALRGSGFGLMSGLLTALALGAINASAQTRLAVDGEQKWQHRGFAGVDIAESGLRPNW